MRILAFSPAMTTPPTAGIAEPLKEKPMWSADGWNQTLSTTSVGNSSPRRSYTLSDRVSEISKLLRWDVLSTAERSRMTASLARRTSPS